MSGVATDDLTFEDHLVDLLHDPESAMALYRHHFREEYIPEDEKAVIELLRYVFDYIETHGVAPTPERIVEAGFEVPHDDPQRPVDDLVEQFKDRYRIAELEDALKRAGRLTRADPMGAIDVGLVELSKIKLDTANSYRQFGNADLLTAYDEIQARKANREGITLGWEEIDWNIGGGVKVPMLTFIVGRLGTYKSWFMLTSAVQAMLSGKRVIFFPLEMGEEEMIERETAMLLGLSWHGWQHNAYDPDEMRERVIELKDELTEETGGDLIWYSPAPEEANVRDLMAVAKERDVDVIYIDQLEDMVPSDRTKLSDPDWLKFEAIVREAKSAIMKDEIPIVIAHQFSREAMSKDVQCLNDLSDKVARSDAIMKRADLTMAIWRPKSLEKDGFLQFGIIKSRQFEKMGWEMKIELNVNSAIRLVRELQSEEYHGEE